jgi:hypothetical protein
MVTTRAGSRAASEVPATPTKATASAAATPASGKKQQRSHSRSASPAPALVPSAGAAGTSSRRRARQKGRVHALRTASAAPVPAVTANPELTAALRAALAELLAPLADDATICPSRVPRALAAADAEAYPDWTVLIPATNAVVWDEAKEGRVVVLQAIGDDKGKVIAVGDKVEGPIRIRKSAVSA